MSAALPVVAVKDLNTDQPVRWCPGCGDFAVLAQLKHALSLAGIPRERLVLVSGFGCSSRLPYYLNTYGFHTVAGRAPTVATGLKAARPDLSVWVITGDGDALSVGGNHLMHALRRNVDIKILMFNNEVLGLTHGQSSPTSRPGTRTRSTPQGSFEEPFHPLSLALAAGASFAARTVDVDGDQLTNVLLRAARHRGSAFVEIYQNCNVYNDGVFEFVTDKSNKADVTLQLDHGRPLLFGQDRNQGLRLNGLTVETVTLGPGMPLDDVLVHDERAADPTLAWLLSRTSVPERPECFGVFRAVERPTFEDGLRAPPPAPPLPLPQFLTGDDAWVVT